MPGFWKKLESNRPMSEVDLEQLNQHVVIVGYGRVGKHLVQVLETLSVPLLVVEADADRIALLNQKQIPTLYGDAGNSEIITHAHLDRASALVTTVPDETTATLVVVTARDLNPKLPIIARAGTEQGVRSLAELGANHIIHPELEGGLELVHHTLLSLGFPLWEVHRYTEAVRMDHYDINVTSDEEHRSLHALLRAFNGIEVVWFELNDASSLVGKSLSEADVRSRTGASVVALIRNGQLIANPKSMTVFEAGDRIGVIGEQDQIEVVQRLMSK
jgi:CPA2 family monovalent cation:H+ antiporter-2